MDDLALIMEQQAVYLRRAFLPLKGSSAFKVNAKCKYKCNSYLICMINNHPYTKNSLTDMHHHYLPIFLYVYIYLCTYSDYRNLYYAVCILLCNFESQANGNMK